MNQIANATALNLLPGPFQPPRPQSSIVAVAAAAAAGGGGGGTSRLALLLPSGEEVHTHRTMNEAMKECIGELDYTHLSVTAGATNKVMNKQDSSLTKLKGIILAGHELCVQKCTHDNLRKLAIKWVIKSARSMSKKLWLMHS